MKIVLTFLVSISSWNSYAQTYTVSKTNVIGLVSNRLGITLEQTVFKKWSAQLMFESGQFGLHDDRSLGGDMYKSSGYGFAPEIRYYPYRGNKKVSIGVFTGLSFRFLKFKEQYMLYYSTVPRVNTGTLTNFGFDVGVKISQKRFWAELLLGYGVQNGLDYDNSNHNAIVPNNYTHDLFLDKQSRFLRTELSIGYILRQKN